MDYYYTWFKIGETYQCHCGGDKSQVENRKIDTFSISTRNVKTFEEWLYICEVMDHKFVDPVF
jgi:hypothetical protein